MYMEGSVPKSLSYYDLMEQNFNSQVPANILWHERCAGPFTEQEEKGVVLLAISSEPIFSSKKLFSVFHIPPVLYAIMGLKV